MKIGRRDAVLLVPAVALLFWLDWHGLRSWFHQDDFAWLALARSTDSFGRLWHALFDPAAQGTVRVWSERAFFIVFGKLFGLDHRPFHLAVLATQLANLALLYWITLRVSRSRLAAAAASLLWTASPALATPLAWLSAYNQILCGFFLLAAFSCLLAWLDSGHARWLAAQAALFLLGLGALETMVVYPVLATAWCWLERRQVPRAVLWLWVPAALFSAAHLWVIPKPEAGVYARHWDFSMTATYCRYWGMALAGGPVAGAGLLPWLPQRLAAFSAAMALAASLWLGWKQHQWKLPALGVVWFTLLLAPLLPLRDHVMDYYLALPAIGLAWILAGGLEAARRHGRAALVGMTALCALYTIHAAGLHRLTAQWRYERGLKARHLILALDQAARLHPGHWIAVTGIDSDLFWAAFSDARLLLPRRICLDPQEAQQIQVPAGFEPVASAFCEPSQVAHAGESGRLTAYSWDPSTRRLRAMTRLYLHRLPPGWRELPPVEIDLTSRASGRWLPEGWYEPEPGGRWTSGRAVALLTVPASGPRRLRVSGMRPESLLEPPCTVRVTANGREIGRTHLRRGSGSFHLLLPLPESPDSVRRLRVELAVDAVAHAPGDRRELGIFTTRLALE